MGKITNIGHAVLRVSDIGAAVDFYHGVLGLELIEQDARGASFAIGARKAYHDFRVFKPREEEASRGTLGLAHIALRLDGDLEELRLFYQHVVEHGVPVTALRDHGPLCSVYVTDPDGNEMEVYVDTEVLLGPAEDGQPRKSRVDFAPVGD